MEEKKNLLTYAGLKKLEDELHDLKVVKRKEVAEKIKEAREQGDLSENAEYDAARDEQRDNEAKIEELEEYNYNMIDNVLNNEKPKEEKQTGRISIKEKLAEKKAVIEQRDKSEKEAPEKGTEKKSEREI